MHIFVCVSVCVYTHTYIYVHILIFVCVSVCVHTFTYTHTLSLSLSHTHTGTNAHTYTHTNEYTHTCMRARKERESERLFRATGTVNSLGMFLLNCLRAQAAAAIASKNGLTPAGFTRPIRCTWASERRNPVLVYSSSLRACVRA